MGPSINAVESECFYSITVEFSERVVSCKKRILPAINHIIGELKLDALRGELIGRISDLSIAWGINQASSTRSHAVMSYSLITEAQLLARGDRKLEYKIYILFASRVADMAEINC